MISSIRKFYLLRADGEQKDLNGASGVWLSDPAGLGAAKTPAYANLNYGFFSITDDKQDAQETITFTLNFTGAEPYYDYAGLVDWIFAATELYFGYQPEGGDGDLYVRRVSVKSIAKTERGKARWLTTAVTLDCLSPWTKEITLTAQSASGAFNVWGWEAPAVGQLPAAFRLSYKPHAARTVSRLTLGYKLGNDYDTKTILFPVPLQLTAGQTLQISTAPNDYYIRRVSITGEITSVMDKIAVAGDPVILLPPGAVLPGSDSSEPPLLQLYVDAIDALDALSCTMLAYYRTV